MSATIRFDPTDSDYAAVVLVDKITHLTKVSDGSATMIHLQGGVVLYSEDSLSTLEARINAAREPA